MKSCLFDYPRLKDFPKKEADSFLPRVCDAITLPTLKNHLSIWCQIGITTSTPAYHTGEERKVIEDFCSLFSPLMDAIYCLGLSALKELKKEDYTLLIRNYIRNYYRSDIPLDDIIDPFSFPHFFYSQFDIQATRSILWILFEAVVIYQGELKAQLPDDELVITYERFLVIAESAYAIMKKIKCKSKKKKTKPAPVIKIRQKENN